MSIWIVFLILLFGLIFIGNWLGIALGGTGMLLLYFWGGGSSSLDLMVSASWNILTNFALTAVPVFIILGELIVATGMASKIYDSLAPLFERLPGGLLHTNVISNALMGAVSGSAAACVSAIGSVAYPMLVKKGYDKNCTAASLAASSTLGIIIPPSIPLILIGVWQDISVAALFAAVLIPGIMMTIIFLIFTAIWCSIRKGIAPRISKEKRMPLLQALWHTKSAWPVVVIIFAVLVSVYLGIATPTEAAGLGVMTILILSACMHTFDLKRIAAAFYNSAKLFGVITLVFVGAVILSISVSVLGLPRQLVVIIGSSGLSNYMVMVLLYILYLILGMFFDNISFLVMTLPFAFPVVIGLGYDPLWFGVMIVMVSMVGMVTPPVGLNLYLMAGITEGQVTLMQLAKEAIPYWLLVFAGLGIVTAFPEICLWLPHLLSGT